MVTVNACNICLNVKMAENTKLSKPLAGILKWMIHVRVFSRDILKGGNIGVLAGGRGVLGVY